MPTEGVRRYRAVERKTMKITVVGAIGIAAIVLAVLSLIQRAQNQKNPGSQPNEAPLGD